MKNLSIFRTRIHWREFIRLVYASIVVAALIVVISSILHLGAVIFKVKFYYSLLLHIPMVMIVILYIGLTSFILEQILPWQKGNYLRISAQGFFGIIGAVFLAYGLARIYYGVHNKPFPYEFYYGWFIYTIIVLVGFGNFYFLRDAKFTPLYYLKDEERSDDFIDQHIAIKEIIPVDVPYGAVIFYSFKDSRRCVKSDFTIVRWYPSIESLASVLDVKDYYFFHDGLVVKREVVDHISNVPGSRKWKVVLKSGYAELVKASMVIPKANVSKSKVWFKESLG